MARDITITTRELTPFEQLVLELLCEGKSNAAIARETNHTEKVIENTVSRSAKAFNITSDGDPISESFSLWHLELTMETRPLIVLVFHACTLKSTATVKACAIEKFTNSSLSVQM